MAVSSISFEDLMKECNNDDPAEFRRLLKRNGFKPVSSRKPIDRAEADTIVERLLGRKIDWYKYKIRERDLVTEGPLEQKVNLHDQYLIDKWYSEIVLDTKKAPAHQDQLAILDCFSQKQVEPALSTGQC